MSWKTLVESQDLIVLEKDYKEYSIKIEARRTENGWTIFKTRVKGESSVLLSEYSLENTDQVDKIIESMKRSNLSKTVGKRISLKREYKEEFVEKWNFRVEGSKELNIAIIKYDTSMVADIVVHKKFKRMEETILRQISEKLGLEEMGESLKFNIFYYDSHTSQEDKQNKEYNYIDIQFDIDPEN